MDYDDFFEYVDASVSAASVLMGATIVLGSISKGRARLPPSRELDPLPRLSRSFALPTASESVPSWR
jgi:hypothetical protein